MRFRSFSKSCQIVICAYLTVLLLYDAKDIMSLSLTDDNDMIQRYVQKSSKLNVLQVL
jgi:hypothetical protein